MKRKWTKEKILEEGKKYDYRSDFKKERSHLYTIARIGGFLEDIFKDKPYHGYKVKGHGKTKPLQEPKVPKKRGRKLEWTKERIIEEARKYDYRIDFYKACCIGYQSAVYQGILDEIFDDKPNKGYKNKIQDKYVVYGTRKRRTYWTKERVIEEGRKYNTRREFEKCNSNAYRLARLGHYMDEIFKDKPNKGYLGVVREKDEKTGKYVYWTEERIFKEASKYPTFKEFLVANPGVKAAIKRMKLSNNKM